ncbi:MAG: hypothetical protein IPN19_11205 [Elusimicrobia bacterium]|nr:hypothetical protein [Elusimicrobiota bacterium]
MTKPKPVEDYLPPGRPSVVTPPVLAKLQHAFGMGCSDKEACLFADISMDALYNYQNKNPGFAEWKALLKEKPVLKARSTVIENLAEIGTAQWYLERKTKGEFANNQKMEFSSKEGKQIVLIFPSEKVGIENQVIDTVPVQNTTNLQLSTVNVENSNESRR